MSEQLPKEPLLCADTPVPQDARPCSCLLAIFMGFNLICETFSDDDQGCCLTCGHEEKCHEHK